ncbi:MAG: hypothetical protein E6Q49_09640 [Limnohabitans sp.]|nr:MAG: hypothetical protein E6Q49_09640 [Limnohabitans sp.]
MNARPLNLLRHPRRVHALAAGARPAVLGAWLVGVLLGGVWGWSQQVQRDRLLDQRVQLQAQSSALREQQARQTAAQEKAQLQSKWGQRAQSWRAQRQHLMELHAALMTQAAETGLRVERWQGDGRQLVLQAWLPRADHVPAVLSGLSRSWATAWTLQSMGDRAGSGVDVVLQAPWPAGIRDDGRRKP